MRADRAWYMAIENDHGDRYGAGGHGTTYRWCRCAPDDNVTPAGGRCERLMVGANPDFAEIECQSRWVRSAVWSVPLMVTIARAQSMVTGDGCDDRVWILDDAVAMVIRNRRPLTPNDIRWGAQSRSLHRAAMAAD